MNLQTIELECAYRCQAIVFRRFSENDGITIKNLFLNLGLKNRNYISAIVNHNSNQKSKLIGNNNLENVNIFEFVNIENPQPFSIILNYEIHNAILHVLPIAQLDETLYMRVTYIKPDDENDDMRSIYSRSEAMIVSFIMVYDLKNPQAKISKITETIKTAEQKFNQSQALDNSELAAIHGCLELDNNQQYLNYGQMYFDKDMYQDAILKLSRAESALRQDFTQNNSDAKESYLNSCLYLSKCYQMCKSTENAYYYMDLAAHYDYIYESEKNLILKDFYKAQDFHSQIDIRFVIDTFFSLYDYNIKSVFSDNQNINATNADKFQLKDLANSSIIINLSLPQNHYDKSKTARNATIIFSIIKTNQNFLRINIIKPNFAQDNDKFSDNKYNIPLYYSFVINLENSSIELHASKCNILLDEAQQLINSKFYIDALLRSQFAIVKLKNNHNKDNNQLYTKSLKLTAECFSNIGLWQKAVFYNSLLINDKETDKTSYIHSLIDADDPRCESQINNFKNPTPKMQRYLYQKNQIE